MENIEQEVFLSLFSLSLSLSSCHLYEGTNGMGQFIKYLRDVVPQMYSVFISYGLIRCKG